MDDDLEVLDAELYKNLMFLKHYEGNAEDLSLSFTIVVDDNLGRTDEVELVKGGKDIPVTNANKYKYIGLVAKHHICDRIRPMARSFISGFNSIISASTLRVRIHSCLCHF